jgi:microcystin-dependent protein
MEGLLFLGQIVLNAGGIVPSGWGACNGALPPINEPAKLFAALGIM